MCQFIRDLGVPGLTDFTQMANGGGKGLTSYLVYTISHKQLFILYVNLKVTKFQRGLLGSIPDYSSLTPKTLFA